jgi:hypothetical protein
MRCESGFDCLHDPRKSGLAFEVLRVTRRQHVALLSETELNQRSFTFGPRCGAGQKLVERFVVGGVGHPSRLPEAARDC